MIHLDSISGTRRAGRSRRPRGYEVPYVRELPRRWDPVQGRELVASSWDGDRARLRRPQPSAGTALAA